LSHQNEVAICKWLEQNIGLPSIDFLGYLSRGESGHVKLVVDVPRDRRVFIDHRHGAYGYFITCISTKGKRICLQPQGMANKLV